MKQIDQSGSHIKIRPTVQIGHELPAHLYQVGETVILDARGGYLQNPSAEFSVIAQLPPLGSDFQYRIKSVSEPYQRVVAEHQLKRVLCASD
ncbi:MAG: hypothetical protein EPN75_03710 [Beijerinckiaceae bacterium]|nr:MAG: hypothetical protein EPN75_03710 [Beijerinckiaceae bacterium]